MYRDPEFLLQLMMQSITGGGNYIYVVLLSAIFLILIFRRDSIESTLLFRLGVILFAIAMTLPPILNPMLALSAATYGPSDKLNLVLIQAIPSCTLGIAVVFLASALMPRFKTTTAKIRMANEKHPLDD